MTDEPRTVRDLLTTIAKREADAYKEVVKNKPESAALNEGFSMGAVWAQEKYAPVLDALIGAQGRVVYTAEDVERAAKVARLVSWGENGFRAGLPWEELDESERNAWRQVAHAALAAAGGVVVDEVITQADGDNGSIRWLNSTDPDEEWSFTDLHPGDRIHITRAKGE